MARLFRVVCCSSGRARARRQLQAGAVQDRSDDCRSEGALAAGASYVANRLGVRPFPWCEETSKLTRATFPPGSRESLKAVVLVFLLRTRRVGLPVDAGIAGFAIGTGFALVENLYYLASRPETSLAVQVISGFGTAIMHGGTTTDHLHRQRGFGPRRQIVQGSRPARSRCRSRILRCRRPPATDAPRTKRNTSTTAFSDSSIQGEM